MAPKEALLMGTCILFMYQQMCLQWLRKRNITAADKAVPAPDFGDLISNTQAFLLSGIPELPPSWKQHMTDPQRAETSSARLRQLDTR